MRCEKFTGSTMKNEKGFPPGLQSSEVDFLLDLLRSSRPGKVLAVDVSEDIWSIVLACAEKHQFVRCSYDTLTECLTKTGDEIDFLIINSVCNMPVELLNFIAVLPYLKQKAIVVLQDAVLADPASGKLFASSILFQTVTAEKLSHNQAYYLDFGARVCLGAHSAAYPQYSGIYRGAHIRFPILSAFRVNGDTRKYVRDLFAALRIRWPFMPDTAYFNAYEAGITKRYSPDILQLYQESVAAAERFFDSSQVFLDSMTNSLFGTFPHVLLYGKGRWGHTFLELSKKLGIQISGFVVSDGHSTEDCEGLPVFTFSQIPFDANETLLIQTANSEAVETALRQSKWHWMKLPGSFWAERGAVQR